VNDDDKIDKFNLQKENKYSVLIYHSIILISIALLGAFIYYTGGTTSFVHLMYIPILSSVFLFGIKEGIIYSIIAGLILGPAMPLVTLQGIMQETRSWIFRIIMFIVIVIVVGLLMKYIRTINELEKKRAYMDITGYPNSNKFIEDLNNLISDPKINILTIIIFEFTNREMISQYIGHDTSYKSYCNLLKIAKNHLIKAVFTL